MRTIKNFNLGWMFYKGSKGRGEKINLPHTWNNIDGQDGGNNYLRCASKYERVFHYNELPSGEKHYIEFKGCNSKATVLLNKMVIAKHEGGYSTFRAQLDNALSKNENLLTVIVDNSKNESVYPQTADFTFYGGIYREVNLISTSANHFDLSFYGSDGVKITPTVIGKDGIVEYEAFIIGKGNVCFNLYDSNDRPIAVSENGRAKINNVHLWNGTDDPYLYKAEVTLSVGGKIVDKITKKIGFRTFRADPDKGFFLNGRSYPLRGVCRHQDRANIGNAITQAHHEEDVDLICELGANTVRLAHYQHDDFFYQLCDERGLVVWAEIPYISRHMKYADNNAVSQMKELIYQQYHHPSIVCWCLSNEITMHAAGSERYELHQILNELCHEIDPTRLTVHACYMVSNIDNKINRISDMVSYNLYFGWYLPFVGLAGVKLDRYHKRYPNEIIGLSEYGAEGMPNLHSAKPRRGDNSEEYQAIYHEKMLQIIENRPFLWATHVWNMFDFAADARNQGGEAGMNHKGLVTFDRKTKKDSFYIYKAYWSKTPFVHICGKRFVNRTGKVLNIKVFSNCKELSLYNNGQLIETKQEQKVFNFTCKMQEKNNIEVKSADLMDNAEFCAVKRSDKSYKIKKAPNKSWEK